MAETITVEDADCEGGVNCFLSDGDEDFDIGDYSDTESLQELEGDELEANLSELKKSAMTTTAATNASSSINLISVTRSHSFRRSLNPQDSCAFFLPKFHCEPNPTEFFLGVVKKHLRDNCDYTFVTSVQRSTIQNYGSIGCTGGCRHIGLVWAPQKLKSRSRHSVLASTSPTCGVFRTLTCALNVV
jgi:hypothetical protein